MESIIEKDNTITCILPTNYETFVLLYRQNGETTVVSDEDTEYTVVNSTNPFNLKTGEIIDRIYATEKCYIAVSLKNEIRTYAMEECINDNTLKFHYITSFTNSNEVSLIGACGDDMILTLEKRNTTTVVVRNIVCPSTFFKVIGDVQNVQNVHNVPVLNNNEFVSFYTDKWYGINYNEDFMSHITCEPIEEDKETPFVKDGLNVWKCSVNTSSTDDVQEYFIRVKSYTDGKSNYFFVAKGNKNFVVTRYGIVQVIDTSREIIRDIYTNKVYTTDCKDFVTFDTGEKAGNVIESVFTKKDIMLFDEMIKLFECCTLKHDDIVYPPCLEPVNTMQRVEGMNESILSMLLPDKKYDINFDDNGTITIDIEGIVVSFQNHSIIAYIRTNGCYKKYFVKKVLNDVYITHMCKT